MSTNMFLMLDGIAGESDDEKHPNWCEITAWDHTFTQPVNPMRASSGQTIEKVTHEALNVTKYIDTTSMKDTDIKTMEAWTPFGDPTLAIGVPSEAPYKPSTPNGPTSGKKGQQLAFTASTVDPDGDDIYYQFDWDDGTKSNWIGPRSSGETITGYKNWSRTGSFQVKVIARDDHGALSDWSNPLAVQIPRERSVLDRGSEGEFTAEMGVRDDESKVLLDGNYRTRGRFKIIWGTATGENKQGRFYGLFNDNRFILKVPTERITIKIIGRVTIEDQEFSGNWITRIRNIRGWIEGEFNPS